MKFSEIKTGRNFIIRLEDGDVIHESIEKFAADNNIKAAVLTALGGVDEGSILITGPEDGRAEKIVPVEYTLNNVFEALGNGTLLPEEDGKSTVHMHLSCGRNGKTVTGCIRKGVKVWHVMEIVLTEIIGTKAERRLDPSTGFRLMMPF